MKEKTKYLRAKKNALSGKVFFPWLAKKYLDDEKAREIHNTIESIMVEVPLNTKYEERYEVAYGNWIAQGKSGYSFIRKNMGQEGISIFINEKVKSLIKDNAGLTLSVISFLYKIAPGPVFKMMAKRMTDEFQWITPSKLRELTDTYAIVDVPKCKVKTYKGTEDFCNIGCQIVYPEWVMQQYQLSMKFVVHSTGCVCYVSTMVPQKMDELIHLASRCS